MTPLDEAYGASTNTIATSFADMAEPYRAELRVHAYRMLGSFDDAEDAVQDAFLRAWRGRQSFDGSLKFRAWLYRITTNVCLDAMRRMHRRPQVEPRTLADVPWLQPFPDDLLDFAAPTSDEPEAVVVARETIELAYVAALQLLPPRQRAVLIMRDVLELPVSEVAAQLEMTPGATNSALQRARRTMRANPFHAGRHVAAAAVTEEERQLLLRFVQLHERADVAEAIALLREDAVVTMPPRSIAVVGRDVIINQLVRALPDHGDWKLRPVTANRQPAAACYLRAPRDEVFRLRKLDVLSIEDGRIGAISTFGLDAIGRFGLPPTLVDR